MKQNMGVADRVIRILLAAAFAALYFTGVINTTVATVLWVIGIVFFITAVVGYCPLYSLFGRSTAKKAR